MTLFVSLVVGAFGVEVLKQYAPGFVGSSASSRTSLSIAVSLARRLPLPPRRLPAAAEHARDAAATRCPARSLAAIVLEASFQILPVFVRYADVNVTLRVLGGPAILLLWLYVMANVIVFGAELNWWLAQRRERAS